jgi:hypothetical protein
MDSYNLALLVLLGVFILFVLSCNVKKQYESMVNEKESEEPLEEVETNALTHPVDTSVQLKDNKKQPDFMKKPVAKVEGFSPSLVSCKGASGTTYSAYGCCADGSAKLDASGMNCKQVSSKPSFSQTFSPVQNYSPKGAASNGAVYQTNNFKCAGKAGTTMSAFGCCADGSAMLDASGSNCAGFAGCNYGVCPGTTTCKTSLTDTCTAPAPSTQISCVGASGTVMSAFGCCSNGDAMVDASGSNCAGFAVCNYGVCPGTTTCKTSLTDSCTVPPSTQISCVGASGTVMSAFGCCSNGTPMTDASGSNCAGFAVCNYGVCPGTTTCKTSLTDTCGVPAPSTQISCVGASGTVMSAFGCCSNGTPMTDAAGSNCAGFAVCNYGVCPGTTTCKTSLTDGCSVYPAPPPASQCGTSMYGCCPDGVTKNNADGTACSASDPSNMYAGVMPQNTSTVFIPPPTGSISSSQPATVSSQSTTTPSSATTPSSSTTSNSTTSSTTSQDPVQQQFNSMPMSCPKPEPCPACARCPESAFECKKVPNYERTDNEKFIPQAVLTDFSSFGM